MRVNADTVRNVYRGGCRSTIARTGEVSKGHWADQVDGVVWTPHGAVRVQSWANTANEGTYFEWRPIGDPYIRYSGWLDVSSLHPPALSRWATKFAFLAWERCREEYPGAVG